MVFGGAAAPLLVASVLATPSFGNSGPASPSTCLSSARRHRRRLPRLVPRHARRHQGRPQLAHDRRRRVGHVVRHRRWRSASSVPTQLRLRPRHRRQRPRHDRRLPASRASSTSRAGDAALVNSGGIWGTADGRAPGAVDLPQPVVVAARLVHARRHDAGRAHRLADGVEARAQPRPRRAHRRRRPRRHRPRLRARLRHRRQHARRGQHPDRRPLRARRHGARPARRRRPLAQVQGRPAARRGAASPRRATAAGPSASPRSPSSRRRQRPGHVGPALHPSRSPRAPGSALERISRRRRGSTRCGSGPRALRACGRRRTRCP